MQSLTPTHSCIDSLDFSTKISLISVDSFFIKDHGGWIWRPVLVKGFHNLMFNASRKGNRRSKFSVICFITVRYSSYDSVFEYLSVLVLEKNNVYYCFYLYISFDLKLFDI